MTIDRDLTSRLHAEGYHLSRTLQFNLGKQGGTVSVFRRSAKTKPAKVLVVQRNHAGQCSTYTEGGPWELVPGEALAHHIELRAAELLRERRGEDATDDEVRELLLRVATAATTVADAIRLGELLGVQA